MNMSTAAALKLFLIFALTISASYCKSCILKLSAIDTAFPPFVFRPDGEFHAVKDDSVELIEGERAVLSCENYGFKNLPGIEDARVTCADGKLKYNEVANEFKHFSCNLKLIEEVKVDVEGCKRQGIMYTYVNQKRNISVKLADVCYDFNMNQMNFLRTRLPYDEVLKLDETPDRYVNINFKTSSLKHFRATSIRSTLNSLFPEMNTDSHYLVDTPVLPGAYFHGQLRHLERLSTNKMALWNDVAEGNWKRLHSDVSEHFRNANSTLKLAMGTVGVLKLDGKEVFLGKDKKYPVPASVWVKVDDDVIIIVNNPFVSVEELKEQESSGNGCERLVWLKRLLENNNHRKPIYGYTFCRTGNEFANGSTRKETKNRVV